MNKKSLSLSLSLSLSPATCDARFSKPRTVHLGQSNTSRAFWCEQKMGAERERERERGREKVIELVKPRQEQLQQALAKVNQREIATIFKRYF